MSRSPAWPAGHPGDLCADFADHVGLGDMDWASKLAGGSLGNILPALMRWHATSITARPVCSFDSALSADLIRSSNS